MNVVSSTILFDKWLTCNFVLTHRAPFLEHLSNAAARHYLDFIIQLMSTVLFYFIGLLSAIFFLGMSSYTSAMVMDMKGIMEEHDDRKSNAVKYQCFLKAITIHWQVLR